MQEKKETPKSEEGGTLPPRGEGVQTFSFNFRLKAVKLYLEKGLKLTQIAKELKLGKSTLEKWIYRYRREGEEGLRSKQSRSRKGVKKLPPAVHEKIKEIKKDYPFFGVRRISQVLRRIFFLPASPETVRRTLHEEKLIEKPRKKPKRNPGKPRFFERATPNQMWQSDILTFRLGGRNAYVIAFMDDYSRYIVGLGLFRSQTAEHVLEVYRIAAGEYGVPKEMLTDNGRQYVNWRGKTRFQEEMMKDRVQHIRSSPHHPMTLGKVERFWKTIFGEFLSRVQFDSFEEAQERVKLWVKHYNHRRTHQSLEGLCPADRFFEIQQELRRVVEAGIQENILEMALRGKPREPFYMVGRMGQQSVVIHAEKGKVKMLVGGENPGTARELVYDVKKGAGDESREQVRSIVGEQAEAAASAVQRSGEVPSGAEPVGGAAQGGGDLPGVGGDVVSIEPVAGPGDGGYARSAGAGQADEGKGPGAGCEGGGPSGEESDAARRAALAAGGAPGADTGTEAARGGPGVAAGEKMGEHGQSRDDRGDTAPARSTAPGRADYEGVGQGDDGQGSSAGAGGQPQDLLQVGGAGTGRDDPNAGRTGTGRQTGQGCGPGEGVAGERGRDPQGEGAGDGAARDDS